MSSLRHKYYYGGSKINIPTNGLIAYYAFNGNGNDGSGNGYHGTVYNTINTTDRNGLTNSAFGFARDVFRSVGVPDNNAFSFTDGTNDKPFSIVVWIYPTARDSSEPNSEQAVIGKYIYPSTEWQMGDYSPNYGVSGYYFFYMCNNGNGARLGYKIDYTNVPLNQWTMLTVTYDGSKTQAGLSLYYNTTKSTTSYASGTYTGMTNTTAPTQIGTVGSIASNGWVGKIDDVAIYNRVLTIQEINNLYGI